jgi:CDP-diacylglycerol--glycerol-3-phosphate 3-phosphatidyltransferase
VPVIMLLIAAIDEGGRDSLNRFLCVIATVFFTLAQISDVVDGYYARKYGVISSFGKFIDPLADKLLSMSTLIMLIPLQRIAAWFVVLLMAREVTITALRGMAAAEGIEIAASDWGKKKTMIQSFAIGALILHYPFFGIQFHRMGMVLLWLTLGISIGSGTHYFWAFFREILQRKRAVKTS